MITATEIMAFARSIFIDICAANIRNTFVTTSDSTLANTNEGISLANILGAKLFDSNTNNLFVIYANITANAQAIVFPTISFI